MIVDVTHNGRDCFVNVGSQQPLFYTYNRVYLNAVQVESTCRHVENVAFQIILDKTLFIRSGTMCANDLGSLKIQTI